LIIDSRKLLGSQQLSQQVRKPYEVRDVVPKTKKTGEQIFTSYCIHCGKLAKKEALFNEDGITVIEKYCDDCLKTETFTALMTFYSRNE